MSPVTSPFTSSDQPAEVASATSEGNREVESTLKPSSRFKVRIPCGVEAGQQVINTERTEDQDVGGHAEVQRSPCRPSSQNPRIYPTVAANTSEDDMADVSIVEVYSRDPVAAARAAAILKMVRDMSRVGYGPLAYTKCIVFFPQNYDYIEHGHPAPGTVTPRKAARRNRISLATSTPRYEGRAPSASKRLSLAELVHETELELAVGSPRMTAGMRAESLLSVLDMPGALPPSGRSTKPQGRHQFMRSQDAIQSPTKTKAWKVDDWRNLERAYRKAHRRKAEKQRAGATSTDVRVDAEAVINTFLQLERMDRRTWWENGPVSCLTTRTELLMMFVFFPQFCFATSRTSVGASSCPSNVCPYDKRIHRTGEK